MTTYSTCIDCGVLLALVEAFNDGVRCMACDVALAQAVHTALTVARDEWLEKPLRDVHDDANPLLRLLRDLIVADEEHNGVTLTPSWKGRVVTAIGEPYLYEKTKHELMVDDIENTCSAITVNIDRRICCSRCDEHFTGQAIAFMRHNILYSHRHVYCIPCVEAMARTMEHANV